METFLKFMCTLSHGGVKSKMNLLSMCFKSILLAQPLGYCLQLFFDREVESNVSMSYFGPVVSYRKVFSLPGHLLTIACSVISHVLGRSIIFMLRRLGGGGARPPPEPCATGSHIFERVGAGQRVPSGSAPSSWRRGMASSA